MKILFLSHYGAMLGANRSLLALVGGLKREGEEVLVWCPKHGAFTQALEKEGIPFEVHGYRNWAAGYLMPDYWLLPYGFLKNKSIMASLTKAARHFGPDLIHTNSSVLPVGAYLAKALNLPHAWHIREFGREDYRLRFFPGRAALYRWLARAQMVIVISKAIEEKVIGSRNINIRHVYNGVVPASHFAKANLPNASDNKKRDTFTFLIIGMLHPNKNQMEALQAFAKIATAYPQARLLIVGKGRRLYERRLRQFADQHRLNEQVEFAGYLSNPVEAYQRSEVVLMCSKYEGMGRVTAEAMAFAKPVIGFNSGATPELIDHRQDGLLYHHGPDELADCMRFFLEHPQEVQAMGQRGYRRANTMFTEETYVQNVHILFKEIIEKFKTTT